MERVLPSRAVDECDVGPIGAVLGVGGRIDDPHRVADAMVVDQRAERAAKLPSGVGGAGKCGASRAGEAERHQLIFRAEIRLRDPANPFRRVVHRAGELKRLSLGAAVDPGAVVEDHPSARVHQPFDHRVGVLGRVIRLRGIRAAGDAFADLAQTGDELGDIAVLGIVRGTPQVPDDVVRVGRIRDPACGPDVLDDRAIGFERPGAREQAIGDDASLKRLVLVMVSGDEARHDDRARAVDDESVRDRDSWARSRAINLPSISTSAFSKSPTLGSRLRTTPPFSRIAPPAVEPDEVLSLRCGGRAQSGELRRGGRHAGDSRRRGGQELTTRRAALRGRPGSRLGRIGGRVIRGHGGLAQAQQRTRNSDRRSDTEGPEDRIEGAQCSRRVGRVKSPGPKCTSRVSLEVTTKFAEHTEA